MDLFLMTELLALAALIFSLTAFAGRWVLIQRLPLAKDRSVAKDSMRHGILYAFTLGMAPWAKESTRLHPIAYLRGIGFHVGIFAGLAALLVSPWFGDIDPLIRLLFSFVAGLGALLGVAGGLMRLTEANLKEISTWDDHLSVWLVTLFLGTMAVALILPSTGPVMWIVAAAMLIYAPLGKIRHCVYFYFGRLFYGVHIGRRGIVRGLEVSHGR